MDINELVNIIKRQTNYSNEIAEEKLKNHNYDLENVIREYMCSDNKISEKKSSSSTTQERYKIIRELMDTMDSKK